MRIGINLSNYRDGKLQWSESPEAYVPRVEPADPIPLDDLATVSGQCALECMYCGATGYRTDEHVIPYALGGRLLVYRGSCVVCQEKAKPFESQLMRSEMANVRFVRGLPSRSKHLRAANVPVTVVDKDGGTRVMHVPVEEAPILLSFPVFPLPKMCSGDAGTGLDLLGSTTAIYGADAEEFLRQHGGKTLKLGGNVYPVSFARSIAKMAYGLAWMARLDRAIPDLSLLARAFLDEPESLGRFVGTETEPYQSHPGLHRVGTVRAIGDVLVMEIQLFAECGAPTYLVALGHVASKAVSG